MPKAQSAIAFRLDDETQDILEKLARELNMTKTAVLEEAIKEKTWREGHKRDGWKLALLRITDSPDGAYFVLPTVTLSGDPGLYGVAHYVDIEELSGHWSARVRDMPCDAIGKTRAEVEANLLDGVRGYIRGNLDLGIPLDAQQRRESAERKTLRGRPQGTSKRSRYDLREGRDKVTEKETYYIEPYTARSNGRAMVRAVSTRTNATLQVKYPRPDTGDWTAYGALEYLRRNETPEAAAERLRAGIVRWDTEHLYEEVSG